MTSPTLFIDGIALWAPTLPSWPLARAALRGEAGGGDPPLRRPAPELLPATERRRVPDTVALALEVALRAVESSGHAAGELLSVFSCTHGDLAITDSVCATLAETPWLISPTKFHNSVHNAAAGYWSIATGCMQASTALSAFDCSFAAGLLEAATQCAAEQRAVLLVAYDVEACGALASTTASRGLLATALLISARRGERSLFSLDWALHSGPSASVRLRSDAARALQANAMADALPLFEALARGGDKRLHLPLSSALSLDLSLQALAHSST